MTFHVTQALVIERTIVISISILLFGLFSIGGLSLWRRFTTTPSVPHAKLPQSAAAGDDHELALAELARRLETASRKSTSPRTPPPAERPTAPSREDASTKA